MKPVRATAKGTQRSEDMARMWAARRRNGQAMMTFGCLGMLLSFGLCASGTVSYEVWGWTFCAVVITALTGIIISSSIPSSAIRDMERQRLAKSRGPRIMSLLGRHGGTMFVSDITDATGWSSAELEQSLELLRDRGLVVIEEDEGDDRWLCDGMRRECVGERREKTFVKLRAVLSLHLQVHDLRPLRRGL